MQLIFPNGSKVIFKGMDKPGKLKSINGVSIVWLEEASEIKYAGYKELKGRLRHPSLSLHFILSTNPVGTENWVYQHFFKRTNDDGSVTVILDDKRLYRKHTIVKNGVYYHHSVVDDNLFVPKSYVRTLDEMQDYDPDLYRVARLGQFGLNGVRVLPQFQVAASHAQVMRAVNGIPSAFKFTGFDFGFETSYNAVVRMAVDDREKVLYIYWEYYKNHMTDDQTAAELEELGLQGEQIIADNEDPKAIQYYRQMGFHIRPCHKWAGSRLANTRKVKRFRKIICSPDCINTIRELSTLTYAKNQKPYMENYLLDGRCSISNNIAENIARPYAVGRKNFLFHDTVKGARASSIIYSLVETAKLNNLNIYAYLETVLLYMPDYKNEPEGIEELMPWSDMIQQRCRIESKS